jgi:demethylmenaquinone methyltransferase/2-methoxy-6-polyprenyl-1,4-benzoquinol methylase
MSASTPPHPVLRKYYASDDARQSFVTALFDASARSYERFGKVMSLGSEQRYRRQALARAGLRPGMKLLDVATGTGLLLRAASRIVREPDAVVGLDPNTSMLREARRATVGPLVQGRAEELPFRDATFDLLSMGYALRHVTALEAAFGEYRRVLKPGGRLLMLEISRPRAALTRWLVRTYIRQVVPLVMWTLGAARPPRLLTSYYWDTIEACVPPDMVLAALRRTGFTGAEHRVLAGVLSEYVAQRPSGKGVAAPP